MENSLNKIVKEDLQYITAAALPWQNLAGKNILITGANGFLPAYVVGTILFLNDHKFKNKAMVYALVRNRQKAKEKFKNWGKRKDLKIIVQDIDKPIKFLPKLDIVIHAASQASPRYYGSDPVGTLAPNVAGTYNLLRLAQQKNAENFLFFSSSEVYGWGNSKTNKIRETDYGYLDPTQVRSCYAESKRIGETMCVSWFKQFDLSTKIIRFFHTYGPGLGEDDGRVFADFIFSIINKKNIILNSKGDAERAFCYVADGIRGLFTVLLKGENAKPYNIGNSQALIKIIDLAKLLVKIYPNLGLKVIKNNKIIRSGYLKSKVQKSCPDISKLKVLGWKPKYSLINGFKRTINSYL